MAFPPAGAGGLAAAGEQLGDRFAGHRGIDQPCPGLDRIGQVQIGAVAAPHCGGDAALRVAGIEEGVVRAVALTRDPARHDWVQRSFGFAAAHRGAAERMAREVLAVAAPLPR